MVSKPLDGLNLLLLDDDGLLRRRLAQYLSGLGAEVTQAANLQEARNVLGVISFELALLDVHLPDGLGPDLLRDGQFSDDATVIVMTAEGGIDGAVEAMNLGAIDYLVKPFEPEELPIVFRRGREKRQSQRIRQHTEARSASSSLLLGSGLADIESRIRRIIESDTRLKSHLPPVLIEGETGTGKTTLARWIHREGPRKHKDLVEINAATLPEKLAEAELFGYEKGAFTDAKAARMGLFEAASGGTLFIDELSSLPLSIQAKILTAIEDHKIRRVGGTREINVDVRIIAATNKPLDSAVAEGEFREDLRHRLDLFRLAIPPLRQRRDDILPLCSHQLEILANRHRRPVPAISPDGEKRLLAYHWPGNVRELLHELERAIVFEDGDLLSFHHLPISGQTGTSSAVVSDSITPKPTAGASTSWVDPDFHIPESGFSIEEAISGLIQKALTQTSGNVSAAARLLGVSRDYIRYREDKKKSDS